MELIHHHHPIIYDPIVEKADLLNISQRSILSDSVLRNYLDTLIRFTPPHSLISQHGKWLMELFPEVKDASPIPHPWTADNLVRSVENVGSVDDAKEQMQTWRSAENEVAYWTGGLELTRAHYEVAQFLIGNNYSILLGREPICYPGEFSKPRGYITSDMVPTSFWAKILGAHGFVFQIPRPLPDNQEGINAFYDNLYQHITGKYAHIVISEADPHKDQKRSRGSTIDVPHFDFPSTTDLWNSYFES